MRLFMAFSEARRVDRPGAVNSHVVGRTSTVSVRSSRGRGRRPFETASPPSQGMRGGHGLDHSRGKPPDTGVPQRGLQAVGGVAATVGQSDGQTVGDWTPALRAYPNSPSGFAWLQGPMAALVSIDDTQ